MNDYIISPDRLSVLENPALLAVVRDSGKIRHTHPHHHTYGQLFGALRGLLSVDAGHHHWVVPATHAVWIPPGMLHGILSHGPFTGWSAWVSASACELLPESTHVLPVSGLLREAILRVASSKDDKPSIFREHLTEIILEEIRSTPPVPLGLSMPQEPRLLRIARELSAHPNDGRSLEEWAQWAGIAPRTLSRKFVSETGFRFSEWRQRVRLLRSLELLAAGTPVTTVALDSGYDNVSAFISLFRQVFGMTPGRYVSTLLS